MAENSWEITLIEINAGVLTTHSCVIIKECLWGWGDYKISTAQCFSFAGKKEQMCMSISCHSGRWIKVLGIWWFQYIKVNRKNLGQKFKISNTSKIQVVFLQNYMLYVVFYVCVVERGRDKKTDRVT